MPTSTERSDRISKNTWATSNKKNANSSNSNIFHKHIEFSAKYLRQTNAQEKKLFQFCREAQTTF